MPKKTRPKSSPAKWEGGRHRCAPLLHRQPELARTALDLGFYVSMSGIVTSRTPRICRKPPRSSRRIGYWSKPTRRSLRPVPHRGKPCEPAFVADTAAFVADLRGETLDELAEARPPTSSDCSGKPPREGEDPRLRDIVRRAADRE